MCRVPLRELFPENAMIGANLRVSSSDTISRIVVPEPRIRFRLLVKIQNSFLVPRININFIGIRIQAGLNPGLDQSFYTKICWKTS